MERSSESLVGCGPKNDGTYWLVKLETLLTRLCPLECFYCHMIHRPGETNHIPVDQELDEEGWLRAAQAYRDLRLPFTAIYGSEPIHPRVYSKLLSFIKALEAPGEGHVDTTIITSCIGMSDKKLRQLYDVGLRSFTTSVDSLQDMKPVDKDIGLKSEKGWFWAQEFKKFPDIRDVEVIFTVSKKNIPELPEVIKVASDHGIWVHFDIVHYSRGQPGSKVYGKPKAEGWYLTKEDMPLVESTFQKVLDLKDNGYLIHPSRESIEKWFDWNYVSLQGWTCAKKSENTWPGFATVEPNGLVRPCDDFLPPEMVNDDPIYVWDLPTRLNEYVERVKYFVEKYKCECFWETHHSAGIINRQGSVSLEHYTHKQVSDK